MAEAKTGDTVRVHYTGRLQDGSVFDSSREGNPLQFTLGEGEIIPGFESAVEGMEQGESKTVTIPADKAYGQRRDDLLLEVTPDQFPDNIQPEVGQQLQMGRPGERPTVVTVADVSGQSVTLDANHPLAGKDLTFDIELVDID